MHSLFELRCKGIEFSYSSFCFRTQIDKKTTKT